MMERTPEEERIFRALSSIQTPDFDIEEAVRQRREQKPAPGRRPLPKAALLCACLLLALMCLGLYRAMVTWGARKWEAL